MKNIIALVPLIAALCSPPGVAVAADDSSAPRALRLAQAGPGPLEADYWRSAEKVGTPEAYQAYLAAFPKGFFAPLAVAALAKAGDTAPAPSPVSVPPAAAALQKIAGDADSSAVPFDIGDVYAGPGVLAVGRLGSYRQFVVPAGHWVALAAQDGHSAHRRPVQMTGMAFGMFDAQGLRSIVTAVFNQRQGRPGNSGWEDAQRCEGEAADALHQWRGTAGLVRQCVLVKRFSALGPTGSWNRGLWGVVRERLQALGAPADRLAGLVTESYFTDHRGGYLRIDRYDFSGPAETAGPALLRARIDAAREYAGLAAAGFDGAFEWEDLKPGEPPPSHPLRPAR